jgi:hypothetical protein
VSVEVKAKGCGRTRSSGRTFDQVERLEWDACKTVDRRASLMGMRCDKLLEEMGIGLALALVGRAMRMARWRKKSRKW